jgi:hypothetical protein
MMTDREVAVATFKAVAALYYAVTGRPLLLTVETEEGRVTINGGPLAGKPTQPDDLQGSHPTPAS